VQALKGNDITVYGDGVQTRSFCYVDDLVFGLIALMGSKNSITGPINLGNPREFTMLELAEKVIAETNSSSKLVFKPLPGDDPKQRRPDITRAQVFLDWNPEITLEDGLVNTVKYFKTVI
jgi:UDP-glucuronate decarboxylase